MELNSDRPDVAIGVVTFNPDLEELNKNLEAVLRQGVAHKVLVDNGSERAEDIRRLGETFGFTVILNAENAGVAKALNQIGSFAKEQGCKFFLTLDQDSVMVEDDFTERLITRFDRQSVGLVCPYVDRYNDYDKVDHTKDFDIPIAITSGSMISVEAWETIGGFWDYLFIDEVDHEFCYRLSKHSFRILQTNSCRIVHKIGTPSEVRLLGKTFHPMNYPAFRRYYAVRNSVILQKLYPEKKEPYAHRTLRLIRMACSIVALETDKRAKLRAMRKGFADGRKFLRNNGGNIRKWMD